MFKDRNKEDREYLHDFATPITILSHVIKKMKKIASGTATPEEVQKQSELITKAEHAIENLNNIHANFKETIFKREQQDSSREIA